MYNTRNAVSKLRDSARSLLSACKVYVIVGQYRGGRAVVIGRYDARSQAADAIIELMSHADPGWQFRIE
jgi:hypothetical protein